MIEDELSPWSILVEMMFFNSWSVSRVIIAQTRQSLLFLFWCGIILPSESCVCEDFLYNKKWFQDYWCWSKGFSEEKSLYFSSKMCFISRDDVTLLAVQVSSQHIIRKCEIRRNKNRSSSAKTRTTNSLVCSVGKDVHISILSAKWDSTLSASPLLLFTGLPQELLHIRLPWRLPHCHPTFICRPLSWS